MSSSSRKVDFEVSKSQMELTTILVQFEPSRRGHAARGTSCPTMGVVATAFLQSKSTKVHNKSLSIEGIKETSPLFVKIRRSVHVDSFECHLHGQKMTRVSSRGRRITTVLGIRGAVSGGLVLNLTKCDPHLRCEPIITEGPIPKSLKVP